MARDLSPSANPSDLREILAVLYRRRLIVVICVVTATGAAVFMSLRQTPIYRSNATVQVEPLDPNAVLNGLYGYAFLTSMQTEVTRAGSPRVAQGAAEIVEDATGSGIETGAASVENPVDTTALDFTYADATPSAAQMWANAYARAYVEDRRGRAQQAYAAAVGGLEEQRGALERQIYELQQAYDLAQPGEKPAIQAQIDDAVNQIATVNAQRATIPVPYDTATQIIAPAELPISPSSPAPLRDGVLGFVLGLGLGVALAFLRERLDDRTAGKGDLEAEIGAPVLAIVPRVPGWRKRNDTQLVARDQPSSPASEAYRTIRTHVQFLAQTEGLRVVAITSASLGEGKTTSSANLAVSLAQSGRRVIVVSCDLRKPRLSRFFGVSQQPGVVELLEGDTSLLVAAKRCGIETLRVVPSGRVPQNPSELLGSDAMVMLLDELRSAADFVIIDTPPVLAVSDTLPLARNVDGVIVVADANTTTKSHLAHVREQLERVGAHIIGGIYNSFDPARGKGYGGYTGYYGEAYGEEPEDEGRRGLQRSPSRILHSSGTSGDGAALESRAVSGVAIRRRAPGIGGAGPTPSHPPWATQSVEVSCRSDP